MAGSLKLEDLNYNINWLNNSISEGHIKYYKYSDFTNIQQIGKGAYGNVVRVNWKNSHRLFAIKSFKNDEQTLTEVVKELKLHRSVHDHENIIRLHGITKMKNTTHQINKYSLVLEYANNSTLNNYLNKYFNKLTWNDKYCLALQLASAVEFLHDEDIIHSDLHASNILVHQDSIKLADFGLSKKIAEASSDASKILGIIPYVDPKKINNQNYKLNKKSDVYSIGVLMWQISSGYEPFKNKSFDHDACLIFYILNGNREEIIDGTPIDYNKLYTECWKSEPNDRPNMQEVVSSLKVMISPNRDDTTYNNIGKKEPEKYKTDSNSGKRTIDINNGLINVESLNIDEYESGVIAESESSSNKVGPSISGTNYYRNQSLLELVKKKFINNDYEKEFLEKYEPNSKLSKRTIDINNKLINDRELLNIDEYEHKNEVVVDPENSPLSALNQIVGLSTEDRNQLLPEQEEDGFIITDDEVEELLRNLTKPKYLHELKLLFENLQNKFSSQILISSLKSLANPTLFDYYSVENVARLELHLRTWISVLERIHFSNSPIVFSKDLLDNVCNSLSKFAEIYYKTIQVVDRSNFNQQKDKGYNYNIDFLLIYLRDMLHSLCDDVTWFHELLKRIKNLLKVILNITSSSKGSITDENYSIESMITQLRQGLKFKYSVASYYIDLRIMLTIQHNLFIWSECSGKIISKKFAEMILMEYIWSFLEREWKNVANKPNLDSQAMFEEASNKVIKTLKNTGNFLSNLIENGPLELPHILWFGILDLAQSLIQKSNRTSTYGLCYYLAIESLNKAPSSFIQFKAIEILLHLHNVDNQMFSMIEDDFDQYVERLNKNNLTHLSEKFQNLLIFIKKKYLEDYKIIGDIDKGKGKNLNQNAMYLEKQISNSHSVIGIIADEMTCPISSEPTDQLCILKCQHILSLNNLKRLKQKICPICREEFEDNDIKYLPQNNIYKNLYPQLIDAGHILSENSEQITNDQCDSDSNNTDIDLILTKKRSFVKTIKLNSNIFSLILPRISRKQHPIYQNIVKELDEKYYQKAEYLCGEYLELFPESYSVRCILAYIYRCLKNYEQAHLNLNEAIELKPKKSIAYFIRGEIFFWQNEYNEAINNLNISLRYKTKPIINLHIILGNSFLRASYYSNALRNYNIALRNDSNDNLCLKNCAYIFEKQEYYLGCLKILKKLVNINVKDSLILCYYGEILGNLGKYNEAVTYFTKAYTIDPENTHNLNKRAIAYFVLQEYDKTLFDLDKVIQLDPSNNIAYYNKGLTYYTKGNIENAIIAFQRCIELDSNDNLSKIQLYYMRCLQRSGCKDLEYDIITKINQIPNIVSDNSLLFIRCKINIEFERYDKAMLDLNKLFLNRDNDVSFIYLLQEYHDFWSYLYKVSNIDHDRFIELGIIDEFNRYMYTEESVYFISNLINLNNEFHQFQVNDTNSLSGQILSFEDKAFSFTLPKFHMFKSCIVWKINVKKIRSKDCFIKFIIKQDACSKVQILKYDDVLKLEGLGWIEYPFKITEDFTDMQPSIEVDGLNMVYYYLNK
ncbi:hypothetical protein RclHR1_06950004 [Rhizophagus clarus]|uniref:Protein kinase domain-containing protein n=1 Tax=Rhizophagus clarus TaxID=94130 RepID=A0A2Z6RU28_9GLOM|nr:hypothetical protein RclHR1_06950004 [Rhizophagus clarus]